jgi:hypothetical protein
MAKRLDRVELFFLLALGLIFLAAKIHFFTRYGLISNGAYLEEHWPFWAAMAFVAAIEIAIRRIRKSLQNRKSI